MARGTQNSKGKNWRWRGGTVTSKVFAGMDRNIKAASIFLAGDIAAAFPSGGEEGTRSGGGGGASSPGGIPFVQTGNLSRNINWRKVKNLLYRIGTGVGTAASVGYALWLEFGTRFMAARPFMRPGLKRNQRSILKIIRKKVI
jgi:hypothetical protein